MSIRQAIRVIFNKLKKSNIIMLHHVSDGKFSPCVLSTENFIQFLDSNEKYISIDKLLKSSAHKYDGSVALTIDDGLSDLYTIAYPLLVERNIPFTAFISVDLLDHEGYITTEQLKEMSKHPLVTIGSHGCTHKCLDELSTEEQIYEINESKLKLESLIGKEIKYFAYSNGKFTKETKKLTKKAGYKRAFGVRPRVYNCISKWYKFDLPRINLTDKTWNK